MTKTGWWHLTTIGIPVDELSESSQEHIADLITQGCTEGQLIEEDWSEEDKGEESFESKNNK